MRVRLRAPSLPVAASCGAARLPPCGARRAAQAACACACAHTHAHTRPPPRGTGAYDRAQELYDQLKLKIEADIATAAMGGAPRAAAAAAALALLPALVRGCALREPRR